MKEKNKISIGTAVKVFSSAAFAVMLVTILYMSHIADMSLKNQAFQIHQTTLSFYRDKVDRSLTELDQYLHAFIFNNNRAAFLNMECGKQERYLAKTGISDELSRIVTLHDSAEGVLFYSPLGDEAEFITRTSHVLNLSESKALKEYVLDMVAAYQKNNRLDTSKWSLSVINGKSYLLRIIHAHGSYCGAWISIESLEKLLREIDFETNSIPLLCSADGEILTPYRLPRLALDHKNWTQLQVEEQEYLQISVPSVQCEFVAAVLIPTSGITEEWDSGFLFVKLFAFLFLILLTALLFSGSFLYRPFKTLVTAMRCAEEGDLDVQIKKHTRLKEFDRVYTIFNSMTAEIKNLKISVYEQKISEQKTMRQYLQMQLKSHFYLNCLNILYSLAQVREYKLIQELTMYLTRYFRYMLKDASKQTPVKEELDHVRNYMNIQEMRFPGKVTYREDVPEAFMELPIPPLMLQTFIENAIQHAINFDQQNDISLSIAQKNQPGQNGIVITIADNGPGFEDKLLAQFNYEEPVTKIEYEKGIGINNIKNRLKIIYGGRAKLYFHNSEPQGAVVEIWLPIDPETEGGAECSR